MRFSRLLLFATFALTTLSLGAQDTHFSLHNYAPLWLNPANTGSFEGSIRAGGVHRGQWYGINGIQTSNLYADAPLAFGLRKQDWIGVGFSYITDDAGEFDITSNFFGFSGAYHFSLDKKRTNILTLGVQYGSTTYNITPDRLLQQQAGFDQSIGGLDGVAGVEQELGMTEQNGNNGQNNGPSYNDLNIGLKLRILMDKKTGNTFEAGVSLLHLNRPRRMTLLQQQDTMIMNPNSPTLVLGEDARRRSGTLHAHARLDMEMSEKWRFQPTAFFQSSAGTSSLSLQAWGSRELKKDLDLRLGVGYRTGDAAKFMLGFDTDRLRAALAYDLTVSQAREIQGTRGDFELGLAYIFNIYKKPTVTPTILCPDL